MGNPANDYASRHMQLIEKRYLSMKDRLFSRSRYSICTFICLLLISNLPQAAIGESQDVVLIVNPQSNVDSISPKQVSNIFLGKFKALPSGIKAKPINRQLGTEIRKQFMADLVNRSESEYKAYWARMMFTGLGMPPAMAKSEEEVIDFVKNNVGAIGYVSKSLVIDSSVKIVKVD